MERHLILIVHTDPDGENKDLLVVAKGLEHAWRIWLDYYFDGDTCDWLGQKIETPDSNGNPPPEDSLRFYQARPDTVTYGALEWHSKTMKFVGYVETI